MFMIRLLQDSSSIISKQLRLRRMQRSRCRSSSSTLVLKSLSKSWGLTHALQANIRTHIWPVQDRLKYSRSRIQERWERSAQQELAQPIVSAQVTEDRAVDHVVELDQEVKLKVPPQIAMCLQSRE